MIKSIMSKAADIRPTRFLCAAALYGVAAGWAGSAFAAVIIDITPKPPYVDTIASCVGGTYKDCTSTAYIKKDPLAGDDATFKKEFDAWNADTSANGGDGKWSLKNGGLLPNNTDGKSSTLTVSLFEAVAVDPVGGLDIRILWNYDGADKSDFYWTQGLYDNYTVGGTIVKPFYELDVNAAETYKPPLYPFQYDDRHFFDGPRGPWPNAFFDAEAFLAKVDATSHVLTIYEGVNYGFVLSVPEPKGIIMLISSLLVFGLAAALSRRRTGQSTR